MKTRRKRPITGHDRFESELEAGPYSAIYAFFKLGCFTVVLLVGATVALAALGFISNPMRQAARVVNKTIDADNMIYNYEWFKQQHQDIQAAESKITIASEAVDSFAESAGPRKEWHFQDREEHSRLSAVLQGLRSQRSSLIADYNARSRMANRSIFKTGDRELPETIIDN